MYNIIYMLITYNNLSVVYIVIILHIKQLPGKHNNQVQITYLFILLSLKTWEKSVYILKRLINL